MNCPHGVAEEEGSHADEGVRAEHGRSRYIDALWSPLRFLRQFQRSRVHAVTQARWSRSIFKDVAEMSVAAGT